MKIGNRRFYKAFNKSGLGITELSNKISLSIFQIATWLNDDGDFYRDINLLEAVRICEVFNVMPSDLFPVDDTVFENSEGEI